MTKPRNLSNEKFGRLKVKDNRLDTRFVSGRKIRFWQCECDCGHVGWYRQNDLVTKNTQSCGCLQKERQKIKYAQASFNKLFASYKYNAKHRNLNFYLSEQEFRLLTSDICYYCGCDPSQEYNCSNNGSYIYNGVDRVDNDIGYKFSNCVSCCKKCNIMKMQLSKNDFITHIHKIYDYTSKQEVNNMTAIVSGVSGQDGSYLCEFLLDKGYTVVGIKRYTSTNNTERMSEFINHKDFILEVGDITDSDFIYRLVEKYKPSEFYNLAAMSHVGQSFKEPQLAFNIDCLGVINILEAIRLYSQHTKLYNAGTSEEFGTNYDVVNEVAYQDENTPMVPASPYAVAKNSVRQLFNIYRKSYNMFLCQNWLFNHESSRRGEEFVTRKITKWIGEYKDWQDKNPIYEIGQLNLDQDDNNYVYSGTCDKEGFPKLRLGNLDAYRDWGHAKDYIEAMYMSLQVDAPQDYVVATGETHSVRDFLDEAFSIIGVDDWSNLVVIDERFYRPCEVEYLCGRPNKIKEELGWEPKIAFKELVREMVEFDVALAKSKQGKVECAT